MDTQADNLLLEILKWIGVAFAAGFIGYFGRYLSMLIIEKLHKRKSRQFPATESIKETPTSRDDRLGESKLKIEKKKVKLAVKKAKKEQKT